VTRKDILRAADSYASLLVLLIANFFLLELVDDPRWGAIGSTLLSAAALVVAISDPDAEKGLAPWHWALVGASSTGRPSSGSPNSCRQACSSSPRCP
jgi:hypothetical protein